MDQNLTITTNIEISADKPTIWDALTNPDKIKIYLFGTETLTDWKEGSAVIFQGEYQGRQYRDKGTVIQNRKNETLQYSYWTGFSGLEDVPENYALVTFTLESHGEKTKLTLTQSGFTNEETRQHSLTTWSTILKQIKQMAEQKAD